MERKPDWLPDFPVLIYCNSEVKAAIEQYPFTEVGVEIASLFAESASDEDFIEYGRCLARKHKNYVIAIYKVHSWEEDGSIKCERRNILE